jgi:transcriptional regulator with XRE-family HTH domain
MNIVIANRLATLRKQNGFSQEELAGKLGISRQAVSKWERAESSPDTDNLIALAELYNISLDALLQSDEETIRNERFAAKAQTESNKEKASAHEKASTDEQAPENEYISLHDLYAKYSKHGKYGKMHYHYKSKWMRFPYPLLVTAIYLMLGFLGGWWHPGWIVFPTIPVYYSIVSYFEL